MVQTRLAKQWEISTMMDALPVEHVVSIRLDRKSLELKVKLMFFRKYLVLLKLLLLKK